MAWLPLATLKVTSDVFLPITPLVVLLTLASLQTIPNSLYEAAVVDGAGRWYSFWHITLPVLAMVIGGFATLTMLTKNSFLEELG